MRQDFGILSAMHERDGMLYVAVNGGSAADSLHTAGDPVKSSGPGGDAPDREELMIVPPESSEEACCALEYGLPAVQAWWCPEPRRQLRTAQAGSSSSLRQSGA